MIGVLVTGPKPWPELLFFALMATWLLLLFGLSLIPGIEPWYLNLLRKIHGRASFFAIEEELFQESHPLAWRRKVVRLILGSFAAIFVVLSVYHLILGHNIFQGSDYTSN